MKSLNSYIDDHIYILGSSDKNWSLDSFLESNDLFDTTPEILEWYARNHWDNSKGNYHLMTDEIFHPSQWINEMLTSHSFEYLYKRLNQAIGAGFKKGENVNEKGRSELYIPYKYWKASEEDIRDTIDKYFWVLSSIRTRHSSIPGGIPRKSGDLYIYTISNHEYVKVTLEPIKSDNVTKYVMRKCGGQIYHITSSKNLDSIMKNGIRMKGEDNSYRFIKNKTYFVVGKNSEELKKNIQTVIDSKGISDAIILKIDLKKHIYNISFFKDTFYKECDVVYTYAYFPPTFIDQVKFEEL